VAVPHFFNFTMGINDKGKCFQHCAPWGAKFYDGSRTCVKAKIRTLTLLRTSAYIFWQIMMFWKIPEFQQIGH
jgi:hypothetical protein